MSTKNYYLTVEERAALKDRIERAVVANINERDVIRAVEIAVEGMYSSKLGCYVAIHSPSEVERLIMINGICGESTMEDISAFADDIVALVGRTNDPDNWVD